MKLLIFFISLTTIISAQTFQSPSNPYYWKNKTVNSDYWQQDVNYKIDAYLDEKEEIIKGKETIVYTNNSPFELKELFFNLYQNAFIENSYLTDLQIANGVKPKFGSWEKANKGNEINSIKIDGVEMKTEIDGSIMKVKLVTPLKSNSKLNIDIDFNTYYSKGGDTRRRMKSYTYKGVKHFNGAHWYPRIAVYDAKFGWCTDQHLNREFYGDFGDYEVNLNFPADYVVEATGEIQNENEVLPDTLRKKLELSNFWNHKWDTAVTFIQKINKGERKTWKYKGRNVHDFAWVAGPTYRLMETSNQGVKVVALVLEPHASGWKNACDFTQKVISVYSRDFGKYAYPKMVVADCQDGMEYPMLTMDGGSDPGYRGLIAHEVGHNWFYGMVNNNETYRAMLDEGFTQFLTVWAQERIDGPHVFNGPEMEKKIKEGKAEAMSVRESRIFWSYIDDAKKIEDPTLNTHSDGFNGALGQGGGYRHVYSKTATMLFNLQYVLGDSLFTNAMKYYFDKWSFKHPYIEDFRQSIIEYTQADLNWFFDQWIETSKHVDYKLNHLKKLDSNKYQLSITRKGYMQMPLDITVWGKSGKAYNFYIPNTWFQKSTNATVLKRWIGWDNKLQMNYKTIISIPEEISHAEIDTTKRLADINELNNSSKFPLSIKFDKSAYTPYLNRHEYQALWRPNIWYNNFDGIKLGFSIDGAFMKVFHKIQADFWVNTTIGKGAIRETNENMTNPIKDYTNDLVSFRLSYQTPTNSFVQNSKIKIEARHLDGVGLGKVEWTKEINDIWSFSVAEKLMWKSAYYNFAYDYQPYTTWGANTAANNSVMLNIWFKKAINSAIYKSSRFTARTSLFSLKEYSYAELDNNVTFSINKLKLKTRFFGRFGVGITPETNLNSGGANGETLMENAFMRSATFFPNDWTIGKNNFSNLQFAGGLNMRGYSFRDYVVSGSNYYMISNNNTGYSVNSQLNFEKLIPFKFNKLKETIGLEIYAFGDIGQSGTISDVYNMKYSNSPWLVDAGIGTSITIKKFWYPNNFKPLTFRFDIPAYLSHPAQEDLGNEFKFRWLLGIEKAL